MLWKVFDSSRCSTDMRSETKHLSNDEVDLHNKSHDLDSVK
jgi:hypothetical protein